MSTVSITYETSPKWENHVRDFTVVLVRVC
jgi:hypothetical protein